MKTVSELNKILFKELKNSLLSNMINGGIYIGNKNRPKDSMKEDIIINTISATQDFLPQIATSNVNIYVPDKSKKIFGQQQLVEETERLDELSIIAMDVLRNARFDGFKIILGSQTIFVSNRMQKTDEVIVPTPDPYRWRYIFGIVLLVAIILLYFNHIPVLDWIKKILSGIRKIV